MKKTAETLIPFPWQQTAWQSLVDRALQLKLPHAILLHGLKGMGKTAFAKAFAAYLLCEKPASHACGECASCQWITAGTHPDFSEIMRTSSDSVIKIDQIRDLMQHIQLTASQGRYKIAVIDDADTLNAAAANALLKTLEAPTPNTILLLVTANPHWLLPTIRSRCQSLAFSPLPAHDFSLSTLEQWIKKQVSIPPEQLACLLSAAEGAPLAVLSLWEQGYVADRARWIQALAELLQGRASPVVLAEQGVKKEPEKLLFFLNQWIEAFIRYSLGQPATQLFDFSAIVVQIQPVKETQRLFYLRDHIQAARQQLQQATTVNQQLLLERIFITILKTMSCQYGRR